MTKRKGRIPESDSDDFEVTEAMLRGEEPGFVLIQRPRRGRPPGTTTPARNKRPVNLRLDREVIDHFKAKAQSRSEGYTTLINAALRSVMEADQKEKAAGNERK